MFTITYIASSLLLIWLAASYKQTILLREDNKPYLIRYTLLSCRFFSVKVHKVLISDSDVCHDHPWNYLSIILKGGYIELQEKIEHIYLNGATPELNTPTKILSTARIKWYKPGSVLYRNAKKFHKLILVNNTPCISLIFTFRKWKSWGYITNHQPDIDYPL